MELKSQLIFICTILSHSTNAYSEDKKFALFNFSDALKPKGFFLGFIELKYQKLDVTFSSIDKSISDSSLYFVEGASSKNDNKCSFNGTVKIEKIDLLSKEKMHYGVDDELKNSGIKNQGSLIGVYEFKETPKQRGCGTFKGKMILNWYVDRNGKINNDDISVHSDGFNNNQYEGIWISNDNKTKKNCQLGRI